MVAAKLANMSVGGIRAGQNTIASQTANLQSEAISRAEAAEMLNVSERTVNAAAKVKDEGAFYAEFAMSVKETSVSPKKKSPRSPDRGLFALPSPDQLRCTVRQLLLMCVALPLGHCDPVVSDYRLPLPSEHIGTVQTATMPTYLAVVIQGREWQSTMAAMEG
jgi:hypothetical protein